MNLGYVEVRTGSRYVKMHTLVVEAAMGKPMPAGSEVHHIDGDKANNAPSNLVACQDRAYHMLLHRRQRALAATGDPNMRLCHYCHQWDAPAAIYVSGEHARHPACAVEYQRQRAAIRAVQRDRKAAAR